MVNVIRRRRSEELAAPSYKTDEIVSKLKIKAIGQNIFRSYVIETQPRHNQLGFNLDALSYTLKMDTASFSETSVQTDKTTRCHNSEDNSPASNKSILITTCNVYLRLFVACRSQWRDSSDATIFRMGFVLY